MLSNKQEAARAGLVRQFIPTQYVRDNVLWKTSLNAVPNWFLDGSTQWLSTGSAEESRKGTGQILDVYVYHNISSPSPSQLFKLQNLYKGDAKISVYNTVLTAEIDQNSSINAGKNVSAMTLDLFREFKWSDGAGTLVPVSFPGIFPDLTRYQAEWEVVSVTASGMSVTSPQSRDILSSPVNVAGTGFAFEGVIGTVYVLDHLYTPIGHAHVKSATGNGNSTFSTVVSYTNTFKSGKQDGLVVLYAANNAGNSNGAAIMIKELLG